jgi:hypothetical protein
MKKTVKKTEALDALANRLRAVLRRETKTSSRSAIS